MAKKNLQAVEVERFSPSIETGLTEVQVAQRLESGLTNKVNQKYSKSYLNILVNNFCTFFNLLGLIVFIALISISSNYDVKLSDFFFVFFYIANISIGIIPYLCVINLIIDSVIASKYPPLSLNVRI